MSKTVSSTPELHALRQKIDATDEEIVRLIARRLETVSQILKEKSGRPAMLRDAERERQVLGRVETLAQSLGLSGPLARKIFSEIITHSLAREAAALSGGEAQTKQISVAYHGTPLTYNHMAAQKYIGSSGQSARFVGARSIAEAVDSLVAGTVDLALVPIENTSGGSINEVYDILRERDLHVVGEETLKVDHCLAALTDVPLQILQRISSHPLALDQCSAFLATLPRALNSPSVDSAEALKAVADSGDPTWAAIGAPEAATAFGLTILRRGIGNHEEILTRYVALARAPESFDVRIPCKTSLILSTRHEHGALLRCLQSLSDYGVSLTKLESRPRPNRPWEYMFFIDIEGNVADPRVGAALDDLRAQALFLKVLGCYPAKATPAELQASAVKAVPAAAGVAAPAPAGVPAPAPTGAVPGANTANSDPTRAGAPDQTAVSAASLPDNSHYRLAARATRGEDTLVRVGDLLIGGNGFTVMAGPAWVESRDQVGQAAKLVRERGAHVLRGGIFKPQAGHDADQGQGYEALAFLAAAGKAFGMPIITEIMSPDQVRPVALHADILQIGARNMQNFALLAEVGKVDRPVLLKRGLSSTIDEWLAAANFILKQGNGQVILCERGIRTFENATRNTLDLSAVVVVRERTHLPIVVDPSQGTGHRAYVAPMAWAARAAGAHGLLIDVDAGLQAALASDDQSLTTIQFGQLMEGLSRWRA